MSVLLLVILVLATIVGSGLRSATAQNTLGTALQSALYGLETALGELQAAAGPHQRITARAQIQPKPCPEESITPGRAHWTGVWDSSKYDPKKPVQKTLLRWPVSARGAAAKLRLPSHLTEAAGSGTRDEIEIFSGHDAASFVKGQRVVIDSAADTERSFPFWVEDGGVKADLRGREGDFPTPQRQNWASLSVAPGPDFGRWLGPFSKVAYPIALGSAGSWLNQTGGLGCDGTGKGRTTKQTRKDGRGSRGARSSAERTARLEKGAAAGSQTRVVSRDEPQGPQGGRLAQGQARPRLAQAGTRSGAMRLSVLDRFSPKSPVLDHGNNPKTQ